VVCGDLVHHFPGMYPHTNPGIRDRQVADFKVRLCCMNPRSPSFHELAGSLFVGEDETHSYFLPPSLLPFPSPSGHHG
jgi:hypothetical protein